jgi:TolB-like protein/DNA-binding winged helix-turn-helix (wHTH) protein/tetratricopeptide (TPR) repeat protein
MGSSEGTIAYLFGDFRLDPNQRVLMLKADGRVLPLTARVIDTLLYFVQHRGELLDKATLMTAIWPNVIVEENNLNQSISILRRVLGDTRDEHRFIVTVPNRGYRFVANVTTETNLPTRPGEAQSIADGAPLHLPRPLSARSRLHAWSFAAAATGGALILMFGYLLWNRVVPTAPRTIAVLPFADMSPNHDQEYFADGLSEELANRLSLLPGLRVIGRTSAFSFKGRHDDLRTIGKALGVNHMLEGSVRKEANQLRITAQLVDSNGTGVWSHTYDQKLGDVFVIQDEVAKSVGAALTVTLTARQNDAARGGTHNAEAYDAYLAGKAIILSDLLEDTKRGIALFEQAVALDPGFALAWSELALTCASATSLPERNSEEWNAKVARATSRALEIAPEQPRVLAAAALVAVQRKDWAQADRRLKKARDLSVGSDNAWEKTGWFLVTVGRPREAAQYMRRAGDAEPLLAFYPAAMSAMYEMSGDLNQAAIELVKSRPLFGNPGFPAGNDLLQAMARHDRAQVERAMLALPEASALPADAFIVSIRSRLGEPQAALAELRRFAEDPGFPKDTWGRAVLAYWGAYFGDPEFSLRMLHEVPADPSMAFVLWRLILKDTRRLPGFKDLVRDLGLVDYWRASGNWGQFCRPLGENDFECT